MQLYVTYVYVYIYIYVHTHIYTHIEIYTPTLLGQRGTKPQYLNMMRRLVASATTFGVFFVACVRIRALVMSIRPSVCLPVWLSLVFVFPCLVLFSVFFPLLRVVWSCLILCYLAMSCSIMLCPVCPVCRVCLCEFGVAGWFSKSAQRVTSAVKTRLTVDRRLRVNENMRKFTNNSRKSTEICETCRKSTNVSRRSTKIYWEINIQAD